MGALLSALEYGLRDKLYPLLLRIIKLQKTHVLVYKNEKPNVENAIWAVSHYCCHDFPYTSEAIGKRAWVLVGKQRLDFASFLGFVLNGVVWVDRKSRDSKKLAAKRLIELLQRGQDIIMFPEGTWNMSQSLPMMPLYWGIIDIARKSKRPIVPVVLDYDQDKCYVKFGKELYVAPSDDKSEKISELRDSMATLKWDIWTDKPITSRSRLSYTDWKKELDFRIAEYPPLDVDYEMSVIRKEA